MANYYTQAVVRPTIRVTDEDLELLEAIANGNLDMSRTEPSSLREKALAVGFPAPGCDTCEPMALSWTADYGEFSFFCVEDIDNYTFDILQWLVKRAGMSHCVVEWANTCSKMRSNGFGGGAAMVYADRPVRSFTTADWIEEQEQNMKRLAEAPAVNAVIDWNDIPMNKSDMYGIWARRGDRAVEVFRVEKDIWGWYATVGGLVVKSNGHGGGGSYMKAKSWGTSFLRGEIEVETWDSGSSRPIGDYDGR